MADGFVGIAEGQAFFGQVVGEVGGGGEALGQRRLHVVGAHRDAAGHVGEDAQGVGDGVDGVEQGFLVFLVVLVVGQRLRLHQGQQAHQLAVDAAGLAAGQFGDVRVLLLRHDRRAGAETVGDLDPRLQIPAHVVAQIKNEIGRFGRPQTRPGLVELGRGGLDEALELDESDRVIQHKGAAHGLRHDGSFADGEGKQVPHAIAFDLETHHRLLQQRGEFRIRDILGHLAADAHYLVARADARLCGRAAGHHGGDEELFGQTIVFQADALIAEEGALVLREFVGGEID
ncbi:MAG: hypothetical protein BWY77_00876 [bacterium ADurb.Bin431]|nr:MAG: hypothetical protein BWY77_00876 [bacterium ADurb.Bin431]